jgi:hypothetical protein
LQTPVASKSLIRRALCPLTFPPALQSPDIPYPTRRRPTGPRRRPLHLTVYFEAFGRTDGAPLEFCPLPCVGLCSTGMLDCVSLRFSRWLLELGWDSSFTPNGGPMTVELGFPLTLRGCLHLRGWAQAQKHKWYPTWRMKAIESEVPSQKQGS